MKNRLVRRRALVPLVAALIACWPVWRWYGARLFGQGGEPWVLVALLTAVLLAWRDGSKAELKSPSLRLPTLLMLAYALSCVWLPPLFRAAIAFTLLGVLVSEGRLGTRLHPGLWGLLLLALPVVASLQFYLGYPLRVLVGTLAAALLQLQGIGAVREGATLHWGATLVSIDAPCSGVKMLWTGLYLSCALACLHRLRAGRTAILVAFAVMAVVMGNTLRATALFYLEAGLLAAPGWTHDGTGLVAYGLTAIAIVHASQLAQRTDACL